MPDEQPNTPSADVTPNDAPTSGAASEPASEPSESPTWWQRITRRQPREREDEPKAEEPAKAEGASPTLTLTQEELDRRVQAETDRREAKRAAEGKAQQKRQLRESDPWAYAEAERKEEQGAEAEQTMVK